MSFFVVKPKKRPFKKPLTVILGKNVSKKATERNLLKRRIKAIMGPIIKKSGRGFSIVVKRGALKLRYDELEKELYDSVI